MHLPLAAALAVLCPQQDGPHEPLAAGPFVGACDADSIRLWARAREVGRYVIRLREAGEPERPGVAAEASDENDKTLHWHVTGLRGAKAPFGWRLEKDGETLAVVDFGYLRCSIDDAHGRARIALGSCADERRAPELPVFGQIVRASPDALVLLGDTPYVESTFLDVQRKRYAAFVAHPSIAACLRVVPTYATWDDHDYATNDRFGDVDGRERSRKAFAENHALDSYGDGEQGIYTRFRRGPIEVFVLDTRWFADEEPCPFEPGKRSLLGARQIGWLQDGLRRSDAAFKVLACGMVWNGAVRPQKLDCWGHWPHERDAILRWLGDAKIGGVVLVGGDLHVTRLIRHGTKSLCGYDVLECVTSPLAQDVIPANAGKTDGVLFDAQPASTFLLLDADRTDSGAQLVLRFVDGAGEELFAHACTLAELTAATAR
ncbi:MAG: alkaline phosphatase family protein [Planctomycetes bacterium]|nr:alkaline phosphatase family protein [Planctomycetota bacterium]